MRQDPTDLAFCSMCGTPTYNWTIYRSMWLCDSCLCEALNADEFDVEDAAPDEEEGE
jgi:hypothetical protein